MIRHFVLLRFREDVTPAKKQSLFDALSALQDHLQGVKGFFAGPNVSVETHLIRGFKEAFWFDFDSVAARDAYLDDARHQAVGAQLVEHMDGGIDGIIVVDLEI
ncbi:MAG: Dabb family protein [Hyphomicrobiales bacterium]|nr:Dabb family protein [Hyphomicrobiales bacterium]MCP5002316.1 Dabb family protein [Hyphomicrobiales bacterium]